MSDGQVTREADRLASTRARRAAAARDARSPDTASPVPRFLTAAGFTVYSDEMGLSLSIEGRPTDFAKAFGVEAGRLAKVAATETVSLEVPTQIRALVDEIVVLRSRSCSDPDVLAPSHRQ